MNAKVTLGLVLVAGAAALWYFKGDTWGTALGLKSPHTEQANPTASSTLDTLAPQTIAKVEVAFPTGESLILERSGSDSGWKMPGNWPLRRPEVEELVETLGTLRTRFHAIPLPEGDDLRRYGLVSDQKPLVVKVTADRQLLTLTFGEPKPTSDDTAFTRPAYVRVNDAPEVLRLGPDVMPVVRRPPDSYRRRTLFPDVERVELAGITPTASPFGAPPAGDGPVTVSLPGGETTSIRVARSVPRVWNLDLSPASSFTLVRTGQLPEPAVQTKGGEAVVPGERLGDAWALDAPIRDRVEAAQLRGVLAAVADLWVDSFADADAHDARLAAGRLIAIPLDPFAGIARFCPIPADVRTGLAGATETVTVQRRNDEPVTVRFGGIAKVAEREEMISVPGGPPGSPPRSIPTKAHSVYRFARVDANPQLFVVAAEKIPDLFATVSALSDPRVANFAREEVREIVVRPAGGNQIKLTLTKSDPKSTKPEEQQDRWFLDANPNPLLADTARVNELLDQLSAFRAPSPDRTAYPAVAPAVETRITLVTRDRRPEGEPDGPARELTLLIGKPDSAKRRLPVQREGWPRVTFADDSLGSPDPDAWVSALLFPNRVSDLLVRPALAYRNRKLFDAAAELAAVSVAGKFALRRDSGEWRLTAPIASDADPGKAGDLAASLSSLGATDYLTATPMGDDLKNFGLVAPTHTVKLEFTGGRAYTLELGAARPGKPEVFARLDGGAVFALPNTVVEQLTTGVVGLLPLKVWTVQSEKITSIAIARPDAPGESYRLNKFGESWQLSGPFASAVPSANAQPILSSLGNLSAVRYQSLTLANPSEYGFDKPLLTVSIDYTETRPAPAGEIPVANAVVVGGATPDGAGRYARLTSPNAPVFVVPVAFVTAAQTPPLDLLNRLLLNLDPSKIAKLSVATGQPGDTFALSKDSTGKWAAEGVGFTVDAERIARLTSAAARPPVTKLAAFGDNVNWADFGLDKPAVTVSATVAGDPETHTIALGKADPLGGRYARIDNGKAVAVLAAGVAEALARKKFEYADRALLSFEPATLVGLTRRLGKDELEIAPAAAIGWDIVSPVKQKADQPFVDELADALSRLRADRVAAYGKKDQVLKEYGLEPPAAIITVTVGERAERKTLRIGNHVTTVALDGDRYAAVESPNAEVIVGVLPAALVNKLLAPPVAFRDRSLAKFVDADRAVLERGDRKVTFAKVGVTWKVVEPISAAAESGELESLVADLGRLRADTWLAEKKGADLKSFGLDRPEAKWTLSNGDSTVLVLLLGKKAADGRLHATTDKGELVGLLDKSITGRVLAEYRQRKPWDLDAAQVTELIFVGAGGPFTLEKDGAAWRDRDRPADPIDGQAINDLLGRLASLQVDRYSIDRGADPKLYGLEKPELTLTIATAGGRRIFEIGAAVGGSDGKQRYARIVEKDRSDVFVLTAADTAIVTRNRAAYLVKK